jgi:hypothetical protein
MYPGAYFLLFLSYHLMLNTLAQTSLNGYNNRMECQPRLVPKRLYSLSLEIANRITLRNDVPIIHSEPENVVRDVKLYTLRSRYLSHPSRSLLYSSIPTYRSRTFILTHSPSARRRFLLRISNQVSAYTNSDPLPTRLSCG